MGTIAKEYAEALFTLALEENNIDEIADGLSLVSDMFSENPEYLAFLSTPSIPQNERSERFEECFSGRIPDTVLRYALVMLSRGDIRHFNESMHEYKSLCFAAKSVSDAVVHSAVPLTEAELRKLTEKLEKLTGNTVRLTSRIDPSLLGGAVVEVDGIVIDGSIKQRMRELKGIISNEH